MRLVDNYGLEVISIEVVQAALSCEGLDTPNDNAGIQGSVITGLFFGA